MTSKRNKLIGERVRYYRTAHKLSMGALAESLSDPITGQQLARYETGQSRWPAELMIDIAIKLGVDIRLLAGVEDGKHEGKESAEWEAERYKCVLIQMPSKAREFIYKAIDGLLKL